MIYRTCIGCVKAAGPCDHRDFLRQKLSGMGITSIKFTCRQREEPYAPGDPVWVELIVSDPDFDESYTADFPATIIRMAGSTAVARVDLDAKSRFGDFNFEAKNENGFVKRPLKYFRPRDGERRTVCTTCSALDGNHEYGWSCHMAAELEKLAAEKAAEREREVRF